MREKQKGRTQEEKLSRCLPTDGQADRQSVQQGGGNGQGHAGWKSCKVEFDEGC